MVSRYGRLCDLPGTTDGVAAECCSASCGVCLRDCVLVCVLAVASHSVTGCTSTGGHVSAATAIAEVPTGSGESQDTDVRRP